MAIISVDLLDKLKPLVQSTATEYARRLPGVRHCDIRVEVSERSSCMAEDGKERQGVHDYAFSFGVRVLAGNPTAGGYYGQLLGRADVARFQTVLQDGVRHAHARALANAAIKATAAQRFPRLGAAIRGAALAPAQAQIRVVPPVFRQDPRSVPLSTVISTATEMSKLVAAVSDQVQFNLVAVGTGLVRELFASSEGHDLDESYALTEGFALVVVAGKTGSLELYDYTGHLRGWEVLTEGYDSASYKLKPLHQFAKELGETAVEVANAPPLKPPEGDVVVVTDPHFNALVCHEVIGHPSELDRALKMETAYAGRSWLFRSLTENQLGKQVASSKLSAFSDPTMDALGHYAYDHEGTPARRVVNIDRGVYTEFLSSRETAGVLEAESNAHYRAVDASMVPLIRMSNTAFSPGEDDPQKILRDVDRGYYVVGHRIPSASESRENFRISAIKVYEVRDGQLGQMYRDGSVMADSRDYFTRVDAVGTDFQMFAIPNCGKGQPMQAKRMGNGGPTMRSVARLGGSGGA
ncbi:MAG: TldD/PmbA family protein [Dehalococcoidia bacterium]|nr:TldD/PmbA family protein [Dehalococcoidia bacterium]